MQVSMLSRVLRGKISTQITQLKLETRVQRNLIFYIILLLYFSYLAPK